MSYLVGIVVQVAGAQDDEHVEVAALDIVYHVVLADDGLLHARLEVVVDELAGDAGDGLLAGGVNLGEYHLVELAQRFGYRDGAGRWP